MTMLERPSNGVLMIVAAVLLLSFSDALVKLIGGNLNVAQLILLRSIVAGSLIFAALRLTAPHARVITGATRWVWLRSISLSAMWVCYYLALPQMSLALAAAFYYTSPVWMALISIAILGGSVRLTGWIAIAISSVGVVLVVNPTSARMDAVVILPILAAIFYAIAGTITWRRCRDDGPNEMALNLNLCLIIVSILWLGAQLAMVHRITHSPIDTIWPAISWWEGGLIVFLGVLLAVIGTLVAAAYQSAPTPLIGVFDTSYLAFAALWSTVLFSQPPTAAEGIGIVLIACGAIAMQLKGSLGYDQ